jgi:hypothetical protein
MATYSQRDQIMLTEAYTLQLLKESIPGMSLKQVQSNLDLMSESELEYVSTVSQRLLEGFFGNLGSGLKNIGKGLTKGASNAAGQASQAIGNRASQAYQGAKQLGSGAIAGAKQIAANTGDMYKTGVMDKQAGDAIEKARGLTQTLIDLITQAQQNGLVKAQGSVTDMSLSDLVDTLETAKQSSGTFAQDSLKKGFTGGAKQAFQKGMQGQ